MTLATWFTLFRIFLVPVFMALVLVKVEAGAQLAAAVFVIAAITDGLDGYIARTWRQVTKFGKLMDPIADKLLISAALVTLVQLGEVSAWVAMIIIGREFAISGLRILIASEGVVIGASRLGKLKTVLQSSAIVAILIDFPYSLLILWFAVVLTIVSGVEYFLRAQKYIKPDGTV